MKRCSISPGQWKLKWTVRYYHIPIRISKTRNWQQQMLTRIWRNRNSHPLLVGTQNGKPLWKTIWQLLRKVNILLPCNPAIMIPGIYQRSWNLCTQNVIAALLKCRNLEIYMWWNIIQYRKEMSYQGIKRYSGKLKIFTKWNKPK